MERLQTAAGVVRYRTAVGFLSEYRRDAREPIVELLNVRAGSPGVVPVVAEAGRVGGGSATAADGGAGVDGAVEDAHGPPVAAPAPTGSRSSMRLKEMMTLRESACYAMTRVQVTLKVVVINLGQCMVSGPVRLRRDRVTLSDLAPTAVKTLSKIINGTSIKVN